MGGDRRVPTPSRAVHGDLAGCRGSASGGGVLRPIAAATVATVGSAPLGHRRLAPSTSPVRVGVEVSEIARLDTAPVEAAVEILATNSHGEAQRRKLAGADHGVDQAGGQAEMPCGCLGIDPFLLGHGPDGTERRRRSPGRHLHVGRRLGYSCHRVARGPPTTTSPWSSTAWATAPGRRIHQVDAAGLRSSSPTASDGSWSWL